MSSTKTYNCFQARENTLLAQLFHSLTLFAFLDIFFSQAGKELVVAGECEGILTHLGC